MNHDYTGINVITPIYKCKSDCTGVIAITSKTRLHCNIDMFAFPELIENLEGFW